MVDAIAASSGLSAFFVAERREVEWCALMSEKIAHYRSC
jgi:hypothetical protein